MKTKKICNSCGELLPLKEFHNCSAVKDGKRACCKKCLNARQKERLNNPEIRARRIAYSRKWNNSTAGRKYHKNYKQAREYKQGELERRRQPRNVDKIKARCAVKDALKYRRLKKFPCAICGDENSEAHHAFGYKKQNWLKVVWLCHEHHLDAHRENE